MHGHLTQVIMMDMKAIALNFPMICSIWKPIKKVKNLDATKEKIEAKTWDDFDPEDFEY